MTIEVHHRTMSGAPVVLVVDLDADGAVLYWRSEDAATREHVELSSPNKWYAISAIHAAVGRMKRGAA